MVVLLRRSLLLHLQVLGLLLLLLGESVWTLYYARQGCGHPAHLSHLFGHGALVGGAIYSVCRLVWRAFDVLRVMLTAAAAAGPVRGRGSPSLHVEKVALGRVVGQGRLRVVGLAGHRLVHVGHVVSVLTAQHRGHPVVRSSMDASAAEIPVHLSF